MSLVYQGKQLVAGKRPGLYIGGKSDAKDLEKLNRWNVTHILNMTPAKDVNVRAGVPNFFEKHCRFIYQRISVFDAPSSASDLLDAADRIVNFISKGLLHGSVLVHCQQGVSRSSAAVALYLMSRENKSLTEAMEIIQRRRRLAAPIPAFMEMLQTYETSHRPVDDPKSARQESSTKRAVSVVGPPPKRAKVVVCGPSLPPTNSARESSSGKEDEQTKASATDRSSPAKVSGPQLPSSYKPSKGSSGR